MMHQLNRPGGLLIVPAMKRALILLGFLSIFSTVAMAQQEHSAIGFLIGGSERLNGSDRTFKLDDRDYEIFYESHLEPDTVLRIKAGQIETPVTLYATTITAFGTTVNTPFDGKGKIAHIDALIDYRFTELFGSTGIFFGPGIYRQKLDHTGVNNLPAPANLEETSWGLSAGINAAFPMTQHYALVVDGTYHWINFKSKQREVTVGVGVKVMF
jgi:hypothetical protein